MNDKKIYQDVKTYTEKDIKEWKKKFKKKLCKNNAVYFEFIEKHPNLKIEFVSIQSNGIGVWYSKKLGRPRKKKKGVIKNDSRRNKKVKSYEISM